jgi:peptide/nickel transport system substrate-binding protein
MLLIAACSQQPEVVEVTRVITETVVEEGETIEVTRIVEGEPETVEVTRVVEVEAEPEEEEAAPTDRNGGWLDTIIFLEEPNQDAAIARLAAGDIDVFADDVAGEAILTAIDDAGNIQTRVQYGLFDELTFNVAACADESILNPFQSQEIREAMNWAIDRDYVANELYGGLAVPKFTAIAEAGADRARYAAEIRAIEAEYAYNLERATEVITTEMEELGATMENGVWTYNGEPVTLIFLIRNEDTRLEIGNYVANQLEDMGFTIERLERTSAELAPFWAVSDPTECSWSVYTGAWSQTVVDRDSVDNFDFYYNPRGYPIPLSAAYEVSPEFDEVSLRLATNDFATLEERDELVAQALPMAAENSNRVWITSRTTLIPFSNDVSVTTDLAAGISGAALWSKTIRFEDEVGGSMSIALPSVFTEPWNPIGGTNWVFDNMVKRGIDDSAFYTDPNTGLAIPGRAERAEIVVQEGFPMASSLDWISVSTEPEVVVPDDAWAEWDAEEQRFLTAGEHYTETQTAVFKSTVYYPEDMFETVTWHDGSPMSVADFVMVMITRFDLADEASPYYDENLVPTFDQFDASFKAVRIASTDPLVIETWADNAQLDAENSVYSWWPNGGGAYLYGSAGWHNMAIMLRGEANGGFAFTPGKSEANGVERTNMIAGPSLDVFAEELTAATEESWIPYETALGEYLSDEEIASRYENLAEFARRYGHYYVGTGSYFLSGVFPVEGQAVLTHNPNHPDPADRFSNFTAPALAEIEIDGEGRVTMGDEATFDVYLDAFGEPYAVDDIDNVAYLLFDATGEMVESGQAEAVEDGLWQVTLSSDTTSALEEGSNRLEIVVASKLVALPRVAGFEFVTTP